jgi:predicted transcriptional regulator
VKISDAIVVIADANKGSFTLAELWSWIDTLEKEGYLKRHSDDKEVTFELTEKGRDKRNKALIW